MPRFLNSRHKYILNIVRAAFFIFFLADDFLFSAGLLVWFGIKDFFYLTPTAGSVVFVFIVILSFFFYRPFCRLICQYKF